MKTLVKAMAIFMLCTLGMHSQTATTTTITGSLRINDSLHVIHNINSTGDITASGEVVAKDTMRAQKDVIVDGNAIIGNNLKVTGTTEVNTLLVNTVAPANIDPCLKVLLTQSVGGRDQLITMTAAQIGNMENLLDANPCPQPPMVPFTWQTYGNHVNSNQRWIGTIENYDFNIKTNNNFQLVCKANGDIGLGAFGGNPATTTGKKYRLFISNTGEISGGTQDASGKYPFVVKANGATSIGFGRPKVGGQAANAMLSVDGLFLAKEIKVAIANTHWADYVFEKAYELKPLSEVEKYILQYKHLPEVPSENEVQQEGLSVADMDATLLKKIEELTLYVIEQNKRIDKLEKENAALLKK